MASPRRVMVALSGASGMVYARRVMQALPAAYRMIYLTASDNALDVLAHELGVSGVEHLIPEQYKSHFTLCDPKDLFAPPASGSHEYEGLVVIPCSMGVVGRIASGVSDDLVTRVADVCLKERRKLVLAIRETPLNLVQLRNLTVLAEAGAVILPAAPAFYQGPKSIDDLVDFMADRVLQALGAGVRLAESWGG